VIDAAEGLFWSGSAAYTNREVTWEDAAMRVGFLCWSRVVVSTLLMVFCSIAVAQSVGAPQLVPVNAKIRSLPPIYQRWLEQDVAYIITPEERAAFLKLPNQKHRDSFVVKFWLERDPTPDTNENEYKEEHYRRIAFSNEQFGDVRPGWQTDRGRTYITYGPPDGITRKPVTMADGTRLPGFLWHYESFATYTGKIDYDEAKKGRAVQGRSADLLFVDRCNCGQYSLQSPDGH
jgi:GWxTD domain-containing protein